MHNTLADYLTAAEDAGELVRVQAEVDAQYESSLCVQELHAAGTAAKTIFFEEVKNAEMPMVSSLFSSQTGVLRAAHCDAPEFGFEKILRYFKPSSSQSSGWLEMVQKLTQFQPQSQSHLNKVKQGACQQVLRLGRDVDLFMLPQVKHAQEETLAVITRAIVQVLSADQSVNITRHFSVSILDSKHLAIHFEEDRQVDQQVKAALKLGQQLAVAIQLGGDPASEIAHFGKMPATLDPLLLTSIFCDRPVDVVTCRTLPLQVPVETEIVIEGLIDPRLELMQIPGCLQSHGYMSPSSLQAIVQAQAITHRANPIYPDMVRGLPRGEEYHLTKFWERITLQFLRLIHPEILDISYPASGIPAQLLFVRLDKRKPYHARQILNFLWSWEFPLTPRTIIMVDHDVNLVDEDAVWKSVVTNTDYARDLVLQSSAAEMLHGVPTNSPTTTRLGIDATKKWPTEGYPGSWPLNGSFPEDVKAQVRQLLSTMKSS